MWFKNMNEQNTEETTKFIIVKLKTEEEEVEAWSINYHGIHKWYDSAQDYDFVVCVVYLPLPILCSMH